MAQSPVPPVQTKNRPQPAPVQPAKVQPAPPPVAQKTQPTRQTAQSASPDGAKKQIRPKKQFLKLDWLFIVACVVVAAQIVLLVLLNNEKNEYETLKQQDADRVYILQKVSTVTQEDIDKLEALFVGEKEVISFIQALEASGPSFEEFTLEFTSDEPQGKDVHFLPFSITASGNKGAVTTFIEKLLNSTYALEATAVELSDSEEDLTKQSLSLTGNLYIQNGK
jgi:hypothetical protein